MSAKLELYHYGVKGMKWGIRKDRQTIKRGYRDRQADIYGKYVTEYNKARSRKQRKKALRDYQISSYKNRDRYDYEKTTAKGGNTNRYRRRSAGRKFDALVADRQYQRTSDMSAGREFIVDVLGGGYGNLGMASAEVMGAGGAGSRFVNMTLGGANQYSYNRAKYIRQHT